MASIATKALWFAPSSECIKPAAFMPTLHVTRFRLPCFVIFRTVVSVYGHRPRLAVSQHRFVQADPSAGVLYRIRV